MSFPGERRLCLLLTRSLCPRDPLTTLRAALEGGVDVVQVREKPFAEDALEWIRGVQAVCAGFDAPVIVNDRLDLARATAADGVHLGQEDLDAVDTGEVRGFGGAIGISTHSPPELERALAYGPDYVGVGPCHATTTKGYDRGLSDDELGALLAACAVPAFAIGGIEARNLDRLVALGVQRIAVSRAILAAGRPADAAARLRRLLR